MSNENENNSVLKKSDSSISPVLRILKKIISAPELYILLFGFLINFWYEVTQIPFFAGWNRDDFWFGENTLAMRTFFIQTFNRAGFFDAILCFGCHIVNSLVFGTRYWFFQGGTFLGMNKKPLRPWVGHLISAFLASTFLVITEINAARNNLWAYSEIMPMIGELGLIPILAMLFTPNLAFLLTRMIYQGRLFTRVELKIGKKLEDISTKEDAMIYITELQSLVQIEDHQRKKGVLIILGFVVVCLLLFAYWYLILFR